MAGPTITSLDPGAFGGWGIAILAIFGLLVASAAAALVLAWLGLRSFYGWAGLAITLIALAMLVSSLLVVLALPLSHFLARDVLERKGRWGLRSGVFSWFGYWTFAGSVIVATLGLPWWIFSACRLARPESWWTERFYDNAKRERAIARYGVPLSRAAAGRGRGE